MLVSRLRGLVGTLFNEQSARFGWTVQFALWPNESMTLDFFISLVIAYLLRVIPVVVLTLDPVSGLGKKSGSGSGMNKPDCISESSETIFWVKILDFFDAVPGCKKFGSGIRDKHPGSATLLYSATFLKNF